MQPTAEPEFEVVETHVSTVLLMGERAYKRKKAVKFPFLDYSTREARLRACEAEVDLNRRLAPDVYLGVTDVRDESGAVVDHLVAMKRMPAARRLSALVREAAPVQGGLREVARQIAVLHARARRSAAIAAAGSPERIRKLWTDNLRELQPFSGAVLDAALVERVAVLALRYLKGRGPLLRRRVREGRIVDGHGDLLADDIYLLPDGPRILDCLEFDERLRHGDVLLDIAFLAMDLERLGAPRLATRLLRWYDEFSGTTQPRSLADFYVAYRALVRTKIACLKEDAVEARRLLDITLRHLELAEPRLVLVGGLPGSGKSTLAAALAEEGKMAVLASDEVRRELSDGRASGAAGYCEGQYTRARVGSVYREQRRRAGLLLSMGESVILDATWRDSHERGAARRLAQTTCSRLVELSCQVPHGIAAARIARRQAVGEGLSDATLEVAARMSAATEPWLGAIRLDTRLVGDEVVSQALSEIGPR